MINAAIYELVQTKNVTVPRSMRVTTLDIDNCTPNAVRAKGKVLCTANIDSSLQDFGIDPLLDEDWGGESRECVLQNSTLSECEYLRNNKKTLQGDAPIRIKAGLTLVVVYAIDYVAPFGEFF